MPSQNRVCQSRAETETENIHFSNAKLSVTEPITFILKGTTNGTEKKYFI